MIKSILTFAVLASSVYGATPATAPTSAPAPAPAGGAPTPLEHISFTQPVGDGISYEAGTNQTFSWTMACISPSKLFSATPTAVEVDFMDSNNIDNAFYVKKVGTIDCSKAVGNLVWTVPADTKPGVYALQLLLTPNNAYSGRFNVTAPGSGSTQGPNSNGGTTPPSSSPNGPVIAASAAAGSAVPAVVAATVLAGGAVLAMFF
ncbi:hypothetical protein BGZ52_005245 [Haplosporangium bisporale]|nr:hypothetical protein BGZ52_005245 [Haplosporangium bisporale]KAF9210892.1 hypothetical protein BGZ59_008807 [Podila verticillata]KFH64538.1 hypothetical protein MVEG_09271 [Podila verticillata NRRL 6337]